jgi:hypothetical protein
MKEYFSIARKVCTAIGLAVNEIIMVIGGLMLTGMIVNLLIPLGFEVPKVVAHAKAANTPFTSFVGGIFLVCGFTTIAIRKRNLLHGLIGTGAMAYLACHLEYTLAEDILKKNDVTVEQIMVGFAALAFLTAATAVQGVIRAHPYTTLNG